MCIVLILINDTFCLITLSPKTIELYFVILSFAHGLPLGCHLFSSEPHRNLIGISSEPHRNLAEGIPKETRRKGGRKAVDKYSKSIPKVYKKTKEILIINY